MRKRQRKMTDLDLVRNFKPRQDECLTDEQRVEICGHNCDPEEHDHHEPPTHVYWGEDGPQLVHEGADGYDEADLEPLPEDYSEETHEVDPVNREFIPRETPLVAEVSLEDKVRALEDQVAQLLARLG